MTVHGGEDGTSDRLGIVDDGTDDLTLYRESAVAGSGSAVVGPGNAEPFEHVWDGIERVQFVDEAGAAINPDNVAGTGPRLVVFKVDTFEYNDDRFTATHLGANETVILIRPLIRGWIRSLVSRPIRTGIRSKPK